MIRHPRIMLAIVFMFMVAITLKPVSAREDVGTPMENPVGIDANANANGYFQPVSQSEASCNAEGEPCPDHIGGYAHIHYVESEIRNYIGWYDYGTEWVCTVSGSAGCTFSADKTSGWSNSWSATIGFSKNVIDASVSADTTASGSTSLGVTLGPYYNGTYQLRYQPNYRFHDLNVRTDYYPDGGFYQEFGTATARVYQYTNWYVQPQ